MANRVPFFFYAPTWDFPPDGPIKLGNVLASLKTPEMPLHTTPLLIEDEALSTEKHEVEISTEKLREGKFSIITKFLSFLGVGVDACAGGSTRFVPLPVQAPGFERTMLCNRVCSSGETFSLESIQTTQFFPREQYFRRCVEAAGVRRFLEKSRYRKPVYIITGLKVVKGARAKNFKASSLEGELGINVDATVWTGGGIPVAGGPGVSGTVSRKQGTSWEGSSDFVLAYRVQKLKISRTGAISRAEDYKTGAMLGNDVEEKEAPELDILLDLVDVGQEVGFVAEEITEGEEVFLCAVPASIDS